MLKHMPKTVGTALRGIRPGLDALIANQGFGVASETIAVTSTAFTAGAPIPAEHTDDGRKVSPPLAWSGVPAGSAEVVLEQFGVE